MDYRAYKLWVLSRAGDSETCEDVRESVNKILTDAHADSHFSCEIQDVTHTMGPPKPCALVFRLHVTKSVADKSKNFITRQLINLPMRNESRIEAFTLNRD